MGWKSRVTNSYLANVYVTGNVHPHEDFCEFLDLFAHKEKFFLIISGIFISVIFFCKKTVFWYFESKFSVDWSSRRNKIKPNMGGGTIFLDLEIQAQPIKNSAVFWYNHLPSGESDDATNHAACPGSVKKKFSILIQILLRRPCLNN